MIDAFTGIAKSYLIMRKVDDAITWAFRALELDAYSLDSHLILAACYKQLGNQEKLAEEIDWVSSQDDIGSYVQACVEAMKGNKNMALALVEAALSDNFLLVASIPTEPYFADFKESVELKTLLEKHRQLTEIEQARSTLSKTNS